MTFFGGRSRCVVVEFPEGRGCKWTRVVIRWADDELGRRGVVLVGCVVWERRLGRVERV